jgi:adenylate cyclase
MERLTFEALCDEADTTADRLRRLVEIGAVRPADDGTFTTGDVQRSRTIASLEAAGITLDQIGIAIAHRWMDFGGLDLFYPPPARRSVRSYTEFRASLGTAGDRLAAIYAAFGLAEPDPWQRMRLDDEVALTTFLGAWDLRAGLDPTLADELGPQAADVLSRAARLPGEGMRRYTEGWVALFTDELTTPLSSDRVTVDELSPVLVPRAERLYAAADHITQWLFRRHMEAALDALNSESTEAGLAARGIAAPRPEAPEAMAFVDLAGFTRLTLELGDASAVSAATRLAELAADSARLHHGRLVKLLGDGVMLHFGMPTDAIRASFEVVAQVGAAELPEAHVGIAAGPLIARDGDYFGHTVNLAARLSARASGGRILVNDMVVEGVGDAADIRFTPAGPQELKGFSAPVAAWWADPAASR